MENEKNIQKVIRATPLSEVAIAKVVAGYDSISGNGTLSATGTPGGEIVRLNGEIIYQAKPEIYCQDPSDRYLVQLANAGDDPRVAAGEQALRDLERTGGWAPTLDARDARVEIQER